MQAQLETFAHPRSDFRIRKIELPRGSCEAGNQFRIQSVPHLVLYRGGERIAEGTLAVIGTLSSI